MASKRLVSLDVFRGATIILMILVNNPGSWRTIFPPLRHAAWHGWTITDLVFPFFLFIVGVAISFALNRAKAEDPLKPAALRKILRRSLILFGLGMVLAAWPFVTFEPTFGLRPSLATIRIPGVLQRIALCYLAASVLYLYTGARVRQIVLWGGLIAYHLAMILGPGSIDDPENNLAAIVDRAVLGSHLWVGTGRMWDPEGLLSTIPALSTTLLGVWTGTMMRTQRAQEAHLTAQLMVIGFGVLSVGYVWDWFFPINKGLWSPSYVAFTGGMAMMVLATCFWLIDVKGYRRWTKPFVVYGVNAITVFVGSGIVGRQLGLIQVGEQSLKTWIFETLLNSWLPEIYASLAYAILWVIAWYAILHVMYTKKWVLKV